jgi:predicted ATPase/DNA-binding SARP family transcriptional activator
MARLALSFLGPFEATLEGVPITTFDSNKVRALLAYLAVEADRPHSREFLAGLLWPDYPERSARTNLRNALANLRKAIRDQKAMPPYLTVTRATIQFNQQSDHWTDVAAFAELADRGSPSDLESALALYRGPFLEALSVDDSAPFEDWCLRVREQLDRQVTSTLEHLAAQYEEQGQVERALGYARRQVELAPWQEEAHRNLMRLLARSGARSAALAQYEACRRALREELDVEPGEETTQLYERIRDGQDLTGCRWESGRWESGGKPVRSAELSNLPVQLTPFIGREEVLAQIGERLRDPNCRLLTLVGPGGSGKTRLALEAAARQVKHYRHGVWFVPLAPLRAVESIVPTIAQSLGLTFHGETEPRAQLLDYVRGKRLLLVLDNAEHLIQEPLIGIAGIATEILRTAPGVKVLVTSRVGLHVGGEHRYPVEGMAYPELAPSAALRAGPGRSPEGGTGELDDAAQYSAIKLFLQSACRAQPDFVLTGEVLPDVVRICQLMKGMPLGILLAAAWVALFTPGQIAAEIERSLDFLESDERDAPKRQRSLRAAFDHSWNLLSERERELFSSLSVFRGGFGWETAGEVAGASARELLALVDKSLLHRSAERRYEVHELLRQYAAEQLATSRDRERAVCDRHAAYYAAALERWAADLKGPRQQTALAEMEAEIEDARAAWDWAVKQRQVERLGQAMEGLGWLYEWRARYAEGESAFRAASEALAAIAKATLGVPVEALRSQARALAWQGTFSLGQGHTASALRLLRQSLRLLSSPTLADRDTSPERAFALLQLGRSMWRSDPEACGQLCEQSRALYRALGDQWGEACALELLGALNYAAPLHAFDRARQMYQESLTIRRRLGDQRGIARSLAGLGDVAGHLGHLEESIRLIQESVEIHRQVGDTAGMARGLYELGYRLMEHGEFSKAHSIMERVIAIECDIGMRRDLVYAHTILGWTRQNLGSYEQARVQYRIALALAQELGFQYGEGMAFFGLGTASMREGTYTEARQLLTQSDVAYQEAGHLSGVGLRTVCSAVVSRALGQPSLARCQLRAALRRASEIGHFTDTVFAVSVMALLLADSGAVERAVEIHALASRYPYVSQSRWWYDCTGRHIAAIAATLPPEVVAAAQERGRARDLWATAGELLGELEATVQDEDRMTEDDH